MIVPERPALRRDFLIELGRLCSVSRAARKSYHRDLRTYYVNGSALGDRAVYNKLKAHVKQSSAYDFQAESVRFGCKVPKRYGDQFDQEADAARDDFHNLWHGSRAGAVMRRGVRWARVYPSVVWKVTAQAGMPTVTLVPDPADVGVFEEDRPFDRQEALVHFFPMDMAQMKRLLKDHPREKDLMKRALAESEMGGGGSEPMVGTQDFMVFDNVGEPIAGGGALVQGTMQLEAQIEAPRTLCAELWVVDDRIKDWRVVTCLAPAGEISDVVWDRRTPAISGVDPFVQLALDEPPDYTWGFSEVDDLSSLQDWRERRMQQIDRMMELQLRPPIVLGGFGGLSEERAKRLRTPDGVLATSIPNPTVQRLAPQMPPEAFAEVKEIDSMFADQGSLPILFNAQSDPGVRSGNQVGAMATLASARPRDTAMAVEYAVSEVATLMWRFHRILEGDPLVKADGSRFLLSQMPRDCEMLVSAHSASPLYAAAIKADADAMLKAGAIGLEDYVTLKDPPMADILRDRARKIQAAKAEQAKRLLAIKEMAAMHGRRVR